MGVNRCGFCSMDSLGGDRRKAYTDEEGLGVSRDEWQGRGQALGTVLRGASLGRRSLLWGDLAGSRLLPQSTPSPPTGSA